MRKFILLLFIVLSCITHPTAKNWYVSTTSSGNASGDSWANKKALSAFNANVAFPGDTIYIDGGSSGLTYSDHGVNHLSIIFYIYNIHGTASNKIIITRGKDSGHNGTPQFTSSTYYGIYLDKCDYVEVSYLKFGPMSIGKAALTISGESGSQTGIDILHNYFDYSIGSAMSWTYTTNGRILHNTFISGTDAQTQSNDAIQGAGYSINTEIGYNYFLGQGAGTRSGNHTDFIQLGGLTGITKVHNNFMYVKDDETTWGVDTVNYQAIYGEYTNGEVQIYNNIIIFEPNSSGSSINLEYAAGSPNSTGSLIMKVFNNTFIHSNLANLGMYAVSSVDFKNNLVKFAGSGHLELSMVGGNYSNAHFDYNQYEKTDLSTLVSGAGSWTNWRNSPYSQDAHSEASSEQFTFANEGGSNAEDYMLASGSSGIDEGTNLSAYFTTDYRDTVRTGTWDVGAFEWIGTKVGTDNTPPTLLGATVINPNTIELLFSEELETTSAQTKANYSISNGIIVNSITLSSDKKKVTLNTSTNSANQNYTVTVTNVKDLSGNVISSNNSAQYSFSSATTGNLKANIKVFLQGAYSGSAMITALVENTFLPSYQPYNTSPWNYSGSEKISNSNLNGVVDWVLVELRNAQDPTKIVSQRAGLLRNDGTVIETDGTTGITFNNLLYGSYYISVRHRNHLAIMTSNPILLAPGNNYDFTKSLTSAFGQNAEAEIASGLFGMFAGDGNADGNINDTDRNSIWSAQNGNMGYLDGDFNLDCGVTVKDTNNYWNVNQGKVTQVP